MDEAPLATLRDIYQDMGEWLKFIEAKHAGMLALWAALWIGILSADFFIGFPLFRVILLGVVTLCASVNFLALSPFLNNNKRLLSRCRKSYASVGKKEKDNLVFYLAVFLNTETDVGKIDYEKKFLSTFNLEEKDISPIMKSYFTQIYDISSVAAGKTYLFKLSVGLAALCLGVGGFILVLVA